MVTTQLRLAGAGAGREAGRGLLQLTSTWRDVHRLLPETHFLKKRLKGQTFGYRLRLSLPHVPFLRSLNWRGRFRPGLSSPCFRLCTSLWRSLLRLALGRRPAALFSGPSPVPTKSSWSSHFICPPSTSARTTTRVRNLISIGLRLGDREAPCASWRRALLRSDPEFSTRLAPWAGGGVAMLRGTVLSLGKDWGQPGRGGCWGSRSRGRKAPPSAQLPWSPEQMATLSPGVRAATFNTFKRLCSACRGSLADIQNRLKTRDGARHSGEL